MIEVVQKENMSLPAATIRRERLTHDNNRGQMAAWMTISTERTTKSNSLNHYRRASGTPVCARPCLAQGTDGCQRQLCHLLYVAKSLLATVRNVDVPQAEMRSK